MLIKGEKIEVEVVTATPDGVPVVELKIGHVTHLLGHDATMRLLEKLSEVADEWFGE